MAIDASITRPAGPRLQKRNERGFSRPPLERMMRPVKLLPEVGKALLGDDFRIVSRLPGHDRGRLGVENSHDAADSSLTYLTTRPGNPLPLPVDEWLHGAARVRGKMFHFET